jgi:hypothetical protein
MFFFPHTDIILPAVNVDEKDPIEEQDIIKPTTPADMLCSFVAKGGKKGIIIETAAFKKKFITLKETNALSVFAQQPY